MLFDYNQPKSNTPYNSDPTQTYEYKRMMQAYKKDKLTGDIFGGIFGAAASLIPGVGSLLGKLGKEGISNGLQKSYAPWQKEVSRDFNAQKPESTNEDSPLSHFSDLLGGAKSSFNFDPKAFSAFNGQAPQVQNLNVGTDSSLVNAPPVGDMGGQSLDIISGAGNMDWSGGGLGFKDGGAIMIDDKGAKMKYFGGGAVEVKGGKGNDDIALVDTNTGKDTGVRVQKGEMIVVSEDNLNALHKALGKGDHKGVFKIMSEQVKKTGEKGAYAEGGVGNTEIDVDKELSDINSKIETIQKQTADAKLSKEKQDIAQQKLMKLNELKNLYQVQANYYKGNQKLLTNPNADSNKDPSFLSNQKDILERMKALKGKIDEASGTPSDKPPVNWFATADQVKEEVQAPVEQPTGNVNGPSGPMVGNPRYETPPVDMKQMGLTSTGNIADLPGNNTSQTIDNPYTSPASVTPTAQTKPFDWQGTLGNLAGSAFDVGRGIAGWNAANTPLPSFTKPPQWVDFMQQLKNNSTAGLSAPEMAALQRNVGQGYAYDVANIRDLSGGNSGQALGNLGRAANQFYGNENQIAALDRNAHTQNLQLYGSYLPSDVNLDRTIFGDKYNNALQTRQAGAQLVNDAIKNMGERFTTNQYYGSGSWNDKVMGAEVNQLNEGTEEEKAMREYYKKYGFTSPTVGSLPATQ